MQRSGAKVLTSRIGRRMIGMFVGCALLPLAAFALIALDQVCRHLTLTAENELHVVASDNGQSLAGRIRDFAADLELARGMLLEQGVAQPAQTQLWQHLRERMRSLSIVEGGVATPVFGDRTGPPSSLAPREQEHLAEGKALLRIRQRAEGEPVVTLLRRYEGDKVLLAEVKNDRLFDIENLRASGAEVMVFSSEGDYLFGSVRQPPDASSLRASLQEQPAAGTVEWRLAGEPHMAHYWRMFLRPQFGLDLLLVQSKASNLVLAPLHGFQWLFTWTTILALLLVGVIGLVQIRRMLTPIGDLQLATERVAAGDLDTLVPIDSKDEFGALAQSFNSMTHQLHENIERREATERQLTAARDAALAAVNAKAEFMTNVSHELRTPLTSILAYAELLTSFPSDDEAQREEFLGVISEQALYLTAMIDKVLDLSTSNQWQLRPTDLGESLQAAVATLPPPSRSRVQLQLPDRLPRIDGVADRLEQLWSLLLDNACKFSPLQAGVTIRVELRGEAVAVSIEDRGEGIGAEHLTRIFEPFCQVGRDIMTTKAKGVGLGLTLAKNIVQRHHGDIAVHSVRGQGTTVTVVLPCLPVAAAAVSLAAR